MLDIVRKACLPAIWSQGVKLSRDGSVSLTEEKAGEATFRVRAPGFAIAPTVTLYFDEAEWSCDCGGKVDPCAHVAAAAIAHGQAAEGGAPLAKAETPAAARVLYRFTVRDGRLSLSRVILHGDGREEPFRGTLTADAVRLKIPNLSPTHDDVRVDRIVSVTSRDTVPLDRVADVFEALAGSGDVFLDGAAARVWASD